MTLIADQSEVAICNAAIAATGSTLQIASLDEATAQARAARLRYPQVRDAILRAYPWNFAAARASLAASAEAPAFGFARAFPLPADCVYVRSVDTLYPWEVEGRAILTDEAAPLRIVYTRRSVASGDLDPLFVEALVAWLGAELAVPLAESPGKAAQLFNLYEAKLRAARARDGQEADAKERFPDGSWLEARR